MPDSAALSLRDVQQRPQSVLICGYRRLLGTHGYSVYNVPVDGSSRSTDHTVPRGAPTRPEISKRREAQNRADPPESTSRPSLVPWTGRRLGRKGGREWGDRESRETLVYV